MRTRRFTGPPNGPYALKSTSHNKPSTAILGPRQRGVPNAAAALGCRGGVPNAAAALGCRGGVPAAHACAVGCERSGPVMIRADPPLGMLKDASDAVVIRSHVAVSSASCLRPDFVRR